MDLESFSIFKDILTEDNAWDILMQESADQQNSEGDTILGIDKTIFIIMVSLCGALVCLGLCNLFFWLWYCCSQYGPVKSRDPFEHEDMGPPVKA